MQKYVDMPVTLPQYLVLTGEPIPRVGLCRQRAKRPTEDTLQGKKFTEELLHGNQEKGCKEEKETLTVRETLPRMGPSNFTKSLPGEAPPGRLFAFSHQSRVVRRQQIGETRARYHFSPSRDSFVTGLTTLRLTTKCH